MQINFTIITNQMIFLENLSELINDPINLLLVEDNEMYADALQLLLSKKTINVKSVLSAEDAITMLVDYKPDLIILDIMLGDNMSGFEFLSFLKQRIQYAHIPVIIISALSHQDKITEGLSLGANDYLVKPFKSIELILKIINLAKLKINFNKHKHIEPIEHLIAELDESYKLSLDFAAMVSSNIQQNIDFNVSCIVKKLGTNNTKLEDVVHKYFYKNPVKYILTKRLERADLMIRNSNIAINNIAYQCGFKSTSYFCTAYKHHFNCTANEARNSQ